MTVEEIRRKIDTEPDYIACKTFEHSLDKLIERYPEGAPMRIISQALMMTEKEVEELYQALVVRLREDMKVCLENPL